MGVDEVNFRFLCAGDRSFRRMRVPQPGHGGAGQPWSCASSRSLQCPGSIPLPASCADWHGCRVDPSGHDESPCPGTWSLFVVMAWSPGRRLLKAPRGAIIAAVRMSPCYPSPAMTAAREDPPGKVSRWNTSRGRMRVYTDTSVFRVPLVRDAHSDQRIRFRCTYIRKIGRVQWSHHAVQSWNGHDGKILRRRVFPGSDRNPVLGSPVISAPPSALPSGASAVPRTGAPSYEKLRIFAIAPFVMAMPALVSPEMI